MPAIPHIVAFLPVFKRYVTSTQRPLMQTPEPVGWAFDSLTERARV